MQWIYVPCRLSSMSIQETIQGEPGELEHKKTGKRNQEQDEGQKIDGEIGNAEAKERGSEE